MEVKVKLFCFSFINDSVIGESNMNFKQYLSLCYKSDFFLFHYLPFTLTLF